MPDQTKPRARRCEVCGKSKAVTWHRMTEHGKTRVIAAHLKCFLKYRQTVTP